MTWTITKTCGSCEHYPNDKHCIGCVWDEDKGENTKWELKKNPIVIERAVLDKIRAEIESQREEVSNKHFGNDELQAYYDGLNDGLKDARDIIDKYKAESEE